jgi:hypothetical protein
MTMTEFTEFPKKEHGTSDKKKPYQQGDVLIMPVAEIPATAKKVKPVEHGFVLAGGEATGHAHTLAIIPETTMWNDGTIIYVSLLKLSIVRHEEHKHITLPAGKYKIGIVREVDPFQEEVRKVKD